MGVSCLKEIGGYFEFEHFDGIPYHKDAIALNCGCSCLAYLVELRSIRSIWIPDFMCKSVADLFHREGVRTHTYAIGKDFLPVYDFEVGEGEWMLIADYYGQLCEADVAFAMGYCECRLIIDETQGFFRRPWKNCDTVYSCRKWFGVADGGYVATADGARLSRSIERDESYDRMGFVLGRLERSAGDFYAESSANNDRLAIAPMKKMSRVTENIMRAIDYDAVCASRNANWDALHHALANVNQIQLAYPECAFMYPLYLGEAAHAVRQGLIKKSIFVPVLWPNVLDECMPGSYAHQYASGIVPLPVDQRYGRAEMAYVLEELQGLMRKRA